MSKIVSGSLPTFFILVSYFSYEGTDRMPDLSKIGAREKLKPRGDKEPHWQRLQAGWYVGYRPSQRGGKGTWFARVYDEEARKYRRKNLGAFGTVSGHEVFSTAKKDAETFAESVETGGLRSERLETVADACRAYLEERPGSIAEGVFRRHVYDDAIARVKLDKLRKHQLQAWRKRLEKAPALISRSKLGEPRFWCATMRSMRSPNWCFEVRDPFASPPKPGIGNKVLIGRLVALGFSTGRNIFDNAVRAALA